MPSNLEQRNSERRRLPGIGGSPNECTVVEFIGIPGAGKSALAHALERRLQGACIVACPPPSEYQSKVLSRSEKLSLDVKYFGLAGSYRFRRLFYDVRHAHLGLWVVHNSWEKSRHPLVLLDKLQSRPNCFYILEEWLLHRTIGESISAYQSSRGFVRSFAFPPTGGHRHVYVLVSVGLAQALERIRRQDQPMRWFARKNDAATIMKTLELWKGHLDDEVRTEIRRRGIRCIEVDGARPVDSNADLLADELLERARP